MFYRNELRPLFLGRTGVKPLDDLLGQILGRIAVDQYAVVENEIIPFFFGVTADFPFDLKEDLADLFVAFFGKSGLLLAIVFKKIRFHFLYFFLKGGLFVLVQ